MPLLVRAQQHDTLDLLCWRHLGVTAGVTEAALELNRDLGTTLSHGQRVMLPDPPSKTAPTASMVNLWD